MSLAFITHPDCLLHEMGYTHPEQPARLSAIEAELKRTGLYEKMQHHSAPLATREQLIRAHDRNYVDEIFRIAPKSGTVYLDADTSMNSYTLQAALRAAGALVQAV